MMYCALEDAFQGPQGAPHPGCGDDEAARQARKEERRRARRSKVVSMGTPAEATVEATTKDPDRQPWNPLPDVPAMKGSKGILSEEKEESFDHYNKAARTQETSTNPASPTRFAYHKDPVGQYARDEMSHHYMTVPVSGQSVATSKRFFGAQGPTDEPYADYAPDSPTLLQPDFTQAFQQRASQGAKAASAALPPPVLDQFWKPLTPSGAQTSFIEHLPPSPSSSGLGLGMGQGRSLRSAYERGEISSEEIMKKLDQLFAKLEDMNQSSPEQLASEMLMFISSGIFVLFLMDLLVKRGGARF